VPNALERGEHGPAAYAQGCRCERCKREYRRSNRERYALNHALNGQPVIYQVSTKPMARHIDELRRQGWTLADIARAAGLSAPAFRHALRHGRTLSTTVDAVLGVG
jgi:hypothetical protein